MIVTEFAVVPECTVAACPELNSISPNELGAKAAVAPSRTVTTPPFSIMFVAVPPAETLREASLLTVMPDATPPKTYERPPLDTMVYIAVPLSDTTKVPSVTVVLTASPPLYIRKYPSGLTVLETPCPPLYRRRKVSEETFSCYSTAADEIIMPPFDIKTAPCLFYTWGI